MHDVLKRNLLYLDGRSQNLADRLREISPDPSLELITAESGDWTARKYSWDGSYQFLHSRMDPTHEARLWTASQGVIMPCIVIIGVGLAYHVFDIVKKCGNMEKVYLIEADERVLQMAMKLHDFSSLMQNPSVHFLIGHPLSAIEEIFTASLMQPFSFHIFFPIVSLYPDIYNPVRESVEEHLCALRMSEGDGVENLLNQMSVA